ncbi:YesL family protein [Salibacterium sp. K-3]
MRTMGGFYKISEWIMRFSIANLLWAFCNLPIGLILLSMLYLEEDASAFLLVFPLFFLVPILFFPATTALFAKAREWVRDDEVTASTQSFFHYYKVSYRTSLFGGVVFVVLWGVWAADMYYFSTRSDELTYVFAVLGILLFVGMMNFFSIAVHYDMKVRKLLQQTFFITIGSPILFLTVAISSGVMLYISLRIFPLLIPLFTGAILSFLCFSAFYKLSLKIQQQRL